MSANLLFSTASAVALIAWLALLASLAVAPLRRPVWLVTGIVIPALLAVGYGWAILIGFRSGGGGGFGSIAEVRRLFADDHSLAAGWVHYLAFDLFVGTWIARNGVAAGLHPLLIAPCLALTFLFGPAGLLLFLAIRILHGPRSIDSFR